MQENNFLVTFYRNLYKNWKYAVNFEWNLVFEGVQLLNGGFPDVQLLDGHLPKVLSSVHSSKRPRPDFLVDTDVFQVDLETSKFRFDFSIQNSSIYLLFIIII